MYPHLHELWILKAGKRAEPGHKDGIYHDHDVWKYQGYRVCRPFQCEAYVRNPLVCKEAHACGKEVHAWTVNYPGDVQRMITYGADGVITDDPALVHRIYLGEEDKKTGFWGLMKYAVK